MIFLTFEAAGGSHLGLVLDEQVLDLTEATRLALTRHQVAELDRVSA